ncbi:DUF6125 family protein [Paraeggerthella hominis]|uniref:DUF6125 family protein n=1 Tax=Paraeggerthella hominis TaxID=2897351 RepID=UPI003D0F11E1
MNDALKNLTKEELLELLEIYAKNLIALDGTWFQSIEKDDGMDAAMHHDVEAWRRFSVSEGRRIKAFLGLDEHPGIEGLAKALSLRCQSAANVDEITVNGNELTYRIVDCRVQNARERKGMGFHPCKNVGVVEYAVFATAIDDRIVCECLSCFPDIADGTCNCAWKFTLNA